MKAVVEWLCPHAGIVRSGPRCEKYGDPYDFAVAFKVKNGVAMIKALVSTKPSFRMAHARAILKALKAEGLRSDWERYD